jgi:transposase
LMSWKMRHRRLVGFMGVVGVTPIGEAFLPGLSVSRLERLYRSERDSRGKLRLLAAILRKEGKTMARIAEELHVPVGTVHAWLRRLLEGGLKKLHDEQRSGRPSMLSTEQLKELRRDLVRGPRVNGFDAPFWTTKIVQEHVRRKFGKEYRARGMRDVLHRVGFSSKMPRPANAKRATKEQVESFKKRPTNSSANARATGSRYSFWTRAPST